MIWLAIFLDLVLLFFAFMICGIIIKLLFVKGYKNYPPFVPTFSRARQIEVSKIASLLQNSSKQKLVVDAGCGTAGILKKLAKEFPQHKFVGIEWNKTLSKIAKFKNRKLKNIEILCQDLFEYNFANVDIVICFLLEPIMPKFETKLLKENNNGKEVFSFIFKFPNIKATEEIVTSKFLPFAKLYTYKL